VNVTARQAESADLDRVEELAAAAAVELATYRGGELYVAREAPPSPGPQALDDASRRVLVGAIDDAVVGYADTRLDPGRDGTLIARIDALYVEPEARAVGVGEELMAGIVGWAVVNGADGIDATALPGARETKNFFERSGFTARLLVMHHRLS
jgi:GNAT superfamily N-acetyltransferase